MPAQSKAGEVRGTICVEGERGGNLDSIEIRRTRNNFLKGADRERRRFFRKGQRPTRVENVEQSG